MFSLLLFNNYCDCLDLENGPTPTTVLSKIQELPNEVLQHMFKHISYQYLYQYLFVCNSWNVSAAHYFRSRTELSGKIIHRQFGIISMFRTNAIFAWIKKYRDHVTTLKFHKDRYNNYQVCYLPRMSFLQSLSKLPNLKTLDMVSSQNAMWIYARCLFPRRARNNMNGFDYYGITKNHLGEIWFHQK